MSSGLANSFNLFRYFHEVRDELQKVTWPSRKQTIDLTTLVIIVSVIVGAYIGALDFVFTRLTALLVK